MIKPLFAGVGGFRLGLEKSWENKNSTCLNGLTFWHEDINDLVANNIDSIPDHDMLVGGFPCKNSTIT